MQFKRAATMRGSMKRRSADWTRTVARRTRDPAVYKSIVAKAIWPVDLLRKFSSIYGPLLPIQNKVVQLAIISHWYGSRKPGVNKNYP